ncbi:MAG: hypothetical protein QM482_02935 [Sulfurospirillum sp.]
MKKSIKNLIIREIESKKILISDKWMQNRDVLEIFTSFGINSKYFKTHFAIQIIEYFISVMKKEKEAGDCPVMSKFVRFMVTKGISPKEVFIICMSFRKILIDDILGIKGVVNDIKIVFYEIGDMFDTNLAGVLEIFENMQKKEIENMQKIKDYGVKIKLIEAVFETIDTNILLLEGNRVSLVSKRFLQLLGLDDLKSYHLKYKNSTGFINDKNILEVKDILNKDKNIEKVMIYNYRKGLFQYFRIETTLIPDADPAKYIVKFVFIRDCEPQEQISKLALLVIDTKNNIYQELYLEDNLNLFLQKAQEQNSTLVYTLISPYNVDIKKDNFYKKQMQKIYSLIKKSVKQDDYLFENKDGGFGVLQFAKNIQENNKKILELQQKIAKIAKIHMVSSVVQSKDSGKKLLARIAKLLKLLKLNESSLMIPDNKKRHKIINEDEYAKTLLIQNKTIESILFYKEIPVYSDSQITYSKETSDVIVSLNKKAFGVVTINSFVYFKISSSLHIKTKIEKIDYEKKCVVLGNILFDDNSPLNRKSVFVEVDFELHIIFSDESEAKAKANFLSKDKIGFEIENQYSLDEILDAYLSFGLDGTESDETIYVRAHMEKDNNRKYIATLNYDTQQSKTINEYISRRQMDIVREISNKIL